MSDHNRRGWVRDAVTASIVWLLSDTGLGPAGAKMSGFGLIALGLMLAAGAGWSMASPKDDVLWQVLFLVFLGLVVFDLIYWAMPPRR